MARVQLYHRVLIGCAFLAAFVALDYVSYVKPYRGIGVTPWNPPPGLSVALVFLGGSFYAPFVLAAPALADLVVRGAPRSVMQPFLAVVATGLPYLVAGLILQRLSFFDPRFRSVRDAITLIAVGIGAVALAGALFVSGLLALHAIEASEVITVAWRAAIGDLIGVLVVVPLALLAWTYRPWPAPSAWMLAQAISILIAMLIVFGYREATAFQLFYLLFLPVLWIALTYGPPGSAMALLLVQAGILIGAEIRFGPDPGLGALQALLIALAITGLIVSAIVAEREDTAARLRDQQAALNRALRIRSAGEIAATIAHEISQPLTALNTYSGVVAKAIRDGDLELATNAAAKIESASARAATVLSSMKEFLRQGTISMAPVDLREVLAELDELLQEDLAKRKISLVMSVAQNLPPISADRIQLQQAVHNLILNCSEAIQDVGRHGQIAVSARIEAGGTCVIEVVDDGPGFPSGYNYNEPTPFTSTKPEGSGLGLGVVRSITEAHGGRLTIASSSRGVTATIRFPITERKLDCDDHHH